jgi:hypothetical protein
MLCMHLDLDLEAEMLAKLKSVEQRSSWKAAHPKGGGHNTRAGRTWTTMLCYTASKVRHAEMWKALRAALSPLGIGINSRWLDWEGNVGDREPTADEWQRHWQTIVEDVDPLREAQR